MKDFISDFRQILSAATPLTNKQKKTMKKKAYEKPSTKVIQIQHAQLLCGSPVVRNVNNNSEGIGWSKDGIEGDDY